MADRSQDKAGGGNEKLAKRRTKKGERPSNKKRCVYMTES
jgi:hypothetical protein